MSHVLTINGRDYIPAGRVGKHFGYTRDYILTLAREGKIDGQKVGHRWYVNLESAENFFSSAKIIREERKNTIREERKAELRTYAVKQKAHSRASRVLEVSAIAMVGVIIGLTGFIANSDDLRTQMALSYASDAPFLEKLAVSLYNLISPEPQVMEKIEVIEYVPDEEEDVTKDARYEESATRTTRTSLVVGPGEVLTTTELESIQASFSDDVSISIDPHNPDVGVIIPHFKDGNGEEYRYLIVPVTEGGTQ
jgi:hypothetical protein